MTSRDLCSEVIAGIVQRPGRSAMTAFGTVLGVAVLVGVLGLTGSAAAQVSARFDPVAANEVSITDPGDGVAVGSYSFLPDAEERVQSIRGVRRAGVGWVLSEVSVAISTLPPRGGTNTSDVIAPVVAASAGFVSESWVTFSAGSSYTQWNENRAERMVIVGAQVARELSLSGVAPGAALWLDGRRFLLAGIVAATSRHPEMLTAVIVPPATAREVFGPAASNGKYTIWAEVDPGAAQVVAAQLGNAVAPALTSRLQVKRPPDPSQLREQVGSDLTQLFLLLAAISLIIGMVGIANTTFVAVIERTGEIGLRRALGARPRHILAQFWIEAATLGSLGGLNGASLGVIVTLLTCWAKQWTAVLDWRIALSGPIVGLIVGGCAGLYPAWRASRIEPVEALRSR